MTEDKFLNVKHEYYNWSTQSLSWVPADGTIWWYDDNGYIFSIIGNGSDDVETLRADQIESYTQAVTKAGCQCDIDGEGTPQIPDNPDGVTYQNAKDWVDGVDGWSSVSGPVAIVNGSLCYTSNITGTGTIQKDSIC